MHPAMYLLWLYEMNCSYHSHHMDPVISSISFCAAKLLANASVEFLNGLMMASPNDACKSGHFLLTVLFTVQ